MRYEQLSSRNNC